MKHAGAIRVCDGCKKIITPGETVKYDNFFDALYHPECYAAHERFLDKLEALERLNPPPIPFELWAPPMH